MIENDCELGMCDVCPTCSYPVYGHRQCLDVAPAAFRGCISRLFNLFLFLFLISLYVEWNPENVVITHSKIILQKIKINTS